MTLTLIIPTRARGRELTRCLACLPLESTILIANDGDADDLPPLEAFQNLRVIPATGDGPGPARNVAALHVTTDWLVFVDDDCLPQPGFIPAYEAAIASLGRDTDTILAGATLRTDAHRDSLLWEAPENTTGASLPPSCNFAISRSLFERSGGFDPRYRASFEDIEFFARLQFQGTTIRFVPEAAVEHPSRPIPSPARRAARWEARVISCHDLGARPFQILTRLPRHVALVIVARLRKNRWTRDSPRAGVHFTAEFLIFLFRLPGWVNRHCRAPRSAFWQAQPPNTIPRFGL